MKCECKKNEKWTANSVGAEGAAKISESLMTNTTLTTLDLYSDDKMWNECIDLQWIGWLAFTLFIRISLFIFFLFDSLYYHHSTDSIQLM